MGYIYKITNMVNNKIYIGKTTSNIEQRFKEHCRSYNKERVYNFPLYRSMRKYGVENFFIEEIEQCDDVMLNDREKYWISYYDTYYGEGYNATLGGEGALKINRQEVLEIYNQLKCVRHTANEVGCDVCTVRSILNEYGIKNFEQEDRYIYNAKKVNQYDKKDKTFIQSFVSSAAAARYLIENNIAKRFG